MTKKNNIEHFINQYRKSKAIAILLQRSFYITIFVVSIFILFSFLEQLIYFNSNSRTRILLLIASFSLSLIILMGSHFLFQLKGKIKNFSNKEIAKQIGEENNSLSDKLINAYELSSIKLKSKLSEQLKNVAIGNIQYILSRIEISNILYIFKTRLFLSLLLILTLFIGLLFNNQFNYAIKRLLNPQKIYEIPLPFSIINFTDGASLLEGDSLNVSFKINGKNIPDSINIVIKESNQILSKKIASKNDSFIYKLENITDDFTFWAEYESNAYLSSWDKIISGKKDIIVTKRPMINSINFEVIPPAYSKLDTKFYSANNTDISILQGSIIELDAITNKEIQYAWILIDDERIDLSSNSTNINGKIKIDNNSKISLKCEDYNQIQNINPPTNRINIIPDYKPQIFIENPETEFMIDDNRLIILDLQIIDDFGFSQAWIEYRMIRPDYLIADSSIHRYDINGVDLSLKAQRIVDEWDISNHPMGPNEQIQFYVLVADNNNITGPSISKSGPFIGRVPSLEDLFANIINMEDDIIESTEEIVLTIDDVKDLVDELEKEMLKSDEVDWEQTKKINQTSEKIDDILNEIESINEVLENIQEEIENNDLVDQDLMNKFDEFQDLLNAIMTPEMLETLNKIKEMMGEMNTDQMLSEIQNLKQDISMLDEQLDRFIELFQRAMAEQAFDEFIRYLEEMIVEQLNISNDLTKESPEFSALELRQNNQSNNFNTLKSLIQNNIKTISKFSSIAGEQLEKLLNSELTPETKNNLKKTENSLEDLNALESFQNSENSMTNLDEFLDKINEIKDQFDRESVNEMTLEFITLIRSVELISFEQESVINQSLQMKHYNPEWKNIAFKQNIIQTKVIKLIEQIIELTNKTLHIPPTINRTIGAAQLAIQKSIALIEQTKTTKVKTENKKALSAMNETAYILIKSLEQMQSTMSTSGMQSYMEQLEEMAKGQQQINQGTGECMMPGGGMPGQMSLQQELMKRLQAQQQKLQEQLGEMMSDNPGEQGAGGLSKALDDMEEVINDFKRKQINRETIERQEKILSRMLDSQKSLKQKDYNEKRKSKSAETLVYDGPIVLPDDKGERQTILTNALQDALEQGYSTDYQIILKKYFKYLEETDEKDSK